MTFAVGDRVRTVVDNIAGHSRLPRYARGRRGVIEAVHGTYAVPEEAGAGVEKPRAGRVYTVAFPSEELWGRTAERQSSVRLDIWQHQLQADEAPPPGGHYGDSA